MAKLALVKGATSQTVLIFIQDSSSTTGGGLTGLVFNSANLVASYARPLAARVAIVLVTQTVTGAFSSGGFVEVDATNMPGVYRLDLPDAALATGVSAVVVMLKGATNMAPLPLEIQLTDLNLNDGIRGGLTALPNVAAEAVGGLYTRGTGAGQINQPSAGQVDANVVTLAAGAADTGDFTAALLNSIADAFLDRVMSTGTDSGADNTSSRTVRQALRTIRNRVAIAAGTATVYKEDDVAASHTCVVTTTAGNPISEVNPP